VNSQTQTETSWSL